MKKEMTIKIIVIVLCVLCIGLLIRLNTMHDCYEELSDHYNDLYFEYYDLGIENEDMKNEISNLKAENNGLKSDAKIVAELNRYMLVFMQNVTENVDEETVKLITEDSVEEAKELERHLK